ncbi:MAG: glycosyltransferase [Candidatus Electrothrix gigas]
MNCSNPLVSIVMPLYNSEAFIRETLDSLLCQTYSDFELIIVDDGSVDQSLAIVGSYTDKRIRLIEQKTNQGIAATLNRGLDAASGKYIARIDSDDIALPNRLACQVAYLEKKHDVVALGSRIFRFGELHDSIDIRPLAAEACAAFLLFATPFVHPTVMMRRSVLEELALRYDPQFSCTEDYEFWERLSWRGKIANVEEQLLKYRIRSGGVTGTEMDKMRIQQQRIQSRMLLRLDIKASEEQLVFHQAISEGRRLRNREELQRACEWLQFIINRNNEKKIWDQLGLAEAIGFIWLRLCRNCGHLGIFTLSKYREFKEIVFPKFPFKAQMIFYLSCLYHQVTDQSAQ